MGTYVYIYFEKSKYLILKKIDVKKNYMIMSIVKNNLKLKKFINTFGHETETNEA